MVKLFHRLVRCVQMAENQEHDSVLKAFVATSARIPPVALTDGLAARIWTRFWHGNYEESDVSRGDLVAFNVRNLKTPLGNVKRLPFQDGHSRSAARGDGLAEFV
jgi:hypothetical protein